MASYREGNTLPGRPSLLVRLRGIYMSLLLSEALERTETREKRRREDTRKTAGLKKRD